MHRGKILNKFLIISALFGTLSLSAADGAIKFNGSSGAVNGDNNLILDEKTADLNLNRSIADAGYEQKQRRSKPKRGVKGGAKDTAKIDAARQDALDHGVSEKDITQERLKRALKAQANAELNFDLLTAMELAYKDPLASMLLYEKAYQKTGSSVYLLEALKMAFAIKDRKNTERYLKLGEKSLADDSEYLRVKIGYYLGKKANIDANTVALKLVTVDPSARSYAILAATYYAMENYELARQYFEKAYGLDKTDENLIRLCDVLLNKLNDSDSAIRIIETHRRIYGCGSGMACEVLADVYRADKRYLDVAKIDEALYEAKGDTKFLDDMIAIYYYSNDFDKIIELLKKYDYKPELLIDAYARKKDYKTAIKMARDEFIKTKNYDFLAIEAIYEYESVGKNVDAKTLSSVVEKFENIAPQLKDPVHLNYYGYILIDHDLDVKKGIDYVQKALKIEPDSPYYIDSLAWGYYKLGECDKAKAQMDRIKDAEFFESPEGKEHIMAIDACMHGGKSSTPQSPVAQNPAAQSAVSQSPAAQNSAPQSSATNSINSAAQTPGKNRENLAPIDSAKHEPPSSNLPETHPTNGSVQ